MFLLIIDIRILGWLLVIISCPQVVGVRFLVLHILLLLSYFIMAVFFQDITDIIANCASTHWADRKVRCGLCGEEFNVRFCRMG